MGFSPNRPNRTLPWSRLKPPRPGPHPHPHPPLAAIDGRTGQRLSVLSAIPPPHPPAYIHLSVNFGKLRSETRRGGGCINEFVTIINFSSLLWDKAYEYESEIRAMREPYKHSGLDFVDLYKHNLR